MNYLYNGVELPALPELTDDEKEQYPYWVIFSRSPHYRLFLADKPAIYKLYSGISAVYFEIGTRAIRYSTPIGLDEPWSEMDGNPFVVEDKTYLGADCWTNHDIYDSDGTLYLAASDPVPVSPVQLNPAALMQSFFVGEAVKRCRGK